MQGKSYVFLDVKAIGGQKWNESTRVSCSASANCTGLFCILAKWEYETILIHRAEGTLKPTLPQLQGISEVASRPVTWELKAWLSPPIGEAPKQADSYTSGAMPGSRLRTIILVLSQFTFMANCKIVPRTWVLDLKGALVPITDLPLSRASLLAKTPAFSGLKTVAFEMEKKLNHKTGVRTWLKLHTKEVLTVLVTSTPILSIKGRAMLE